VFLLLFWPLHPHASNPVLLPGLPLRYQAPLRQAIFFAASCAAGCYLIHISNEYGGACYCELCAAAFREWLQKKYDNLAALNAALLVATAAARIFSPSTRGAYSSSI
jgi:hypothetical protein